MGNIKAGVISFAVFVLAMLGGFGIAQQKPLWNDELYSYTVTRHKSVGDILAGHVPEGNNSPLFYLLQKAVCFVSGYAPQSDDWELLERGPGMISLRILPVFCMSASIALIFFYFFRWYSWMAGLLSLFVYATSYMLWVYWAEARPYAFLVLLTTIQSLMLVHIVAKGKGVGNGWVGLAVTHTFLGLTSVLSMGQILAAAVILWFSNERRWQCHVFLSLLPCILILFYYYHAPKYLFWFNMSPEQLIRDNISREKFYFFIVFMLMGLAAWIGQKKGRVLFEKGQEIQKLFPYFSFVSMAFMATIAILTLFMFKDSKGQGFTVSNRYFIYLMPLGIILTTWVLVVIFRVLGQWRLLQVIFSLAAGYLLVQRFLKIVISAIKSILGG